MLCSPRRVPAAAVPPLLRPRRRRNRRRRSPSVARRTPPVHPRLGARGTRGSWPRSTSRPSARPRWRSPSSARATRTPIPGPRDPSRRGAASTRWRACARLVVTSPENGERGDFGRRLHRGLHEATSSRGAPRASSARAAARPSDVARGALHAGRGHRGRHARAPRVPRRRSVPRGPRRLAGRDDRRHGPQGRAPAAPSTPSSAPPSPARAGRRRPWCVTALLPAAVRDKLKAELGPERRRGGRQGLRRGPGGDAAGRPRLA